MDLGQEISCSFHAVIRIQASITVAYVLGDKNIEAGTIYSVPIYLYLVFGLLFLNHFLGVILIL